MGQRPSAFLVDDRVLVDAGTVGAALTVAEQVEIQHALISHAHLDHIAGLAFLTKDEKKENDHGGDKSHE